MWRRYLGVGTTSEWFLVYSLVAANVAVGCVVVRIAWPYRHMLAALVSR